MKREAVLVRRDIVAGWLVRTVFWPIDDQERLKRRAVSP